MKNIKQVPPPRKHQVECFNFIKNKDFFALFMDMGTGKSKVILMKLSYLIDKGEVDKAIIILPNYLKYSWEEDHFQEHFDKPYKTFVYEGNITSQKGKEKFNTFCQTKDKCRVFVVNVEAFQSENIDKWVKLFLDDHKCMVVIDESIVIKNPKAKRTIKIVKGFSKLKHKAILSGTPTPNSPNDLYSQFDFLKSLFFRCSYFQFMHKHTLLTQQKTSTNKRYNAILTEDEYALIKRKLKVQNILTADYIGELAIRYNISEANIIRIHKMDKYTPYKDLDKLYESISTVTFRVLKEDCLDLPDKVYEKITVELNADQKRMYKELTKDFFTILGDSQLTVSNSLSLLMRLRMITGGVFPYYDMKKINFDDLENFNPNKHKAIKRIDNNPKIKAVIDDIANSPLETSIIIWSNFVETIKWLHEEISKEYTCEMYFGETKDRPEVIERFKNKTIKVLIINPATGGMGLNLQVSNLHYFFDNSERADFRTQAEDRSHRDGQTNKVVYKDVIARGTVDEKIVTLLKNKIGLINFFKNKDGKEGLKDLLGNI